MMRVTANILLLGTISLCLLSATSAGAQDYSGWWWNPEASGTGFALQVWDLPGMDYDEAYLVWYLYDDSGLNTWCSAILQVKGATMTGDLAVYDGWPLEPGVVSQIKATNFGQVDITFDDENSGIIRCSLESRRYEIPVQRWEQAGEADPRNLTGWWWDEVNRWIGWFIEAKNDRLFLGWYNYRDPPEGYAGNGMPRWFISLDNDFAPGDAEFSAPLCDYSGGQTMTGPYAAPAVEIKEEALSFDIPQDAAPDSLDIIYGGNAYHLTRFPYPNINFSMKTTLVVLSHAPTGEVLPGSLPIIQIAIQSPGRADIDKDTIQMRVNGELVDHTVAVVAPPGEAYIQYQVTEPFPDSSEVVINFYAADVGGQKLYYDWSFTVGSGSN